MPTAWGTVNGRTAIRCPMPLNISEATQTGYTFITGNHSQYRPVAWWRGIKDNDTTKLGNLEWLLYPDNGQFVGVTEQTFVRAPRVRVGVVYYPTMTMIGWAWSDNNGPGNWSIGYKASLTQSGAYLALDQTDHNNYAAIAFDPNRVFNLTGFDLITPVA